MTSSFLHDFMNPASIAIVGAGNNPMKMGTMHALSLLKNGFKGKFYPIHPREKTVLGHTAYPSVKDLPEAPDLALFVLPAKYLLEIFEDFGKIGTRFAIIITAGFKETGEEGEALELRLKSIADRYKMRFIGPNCMGVVNRHISLNTTVTPISGKPGPLGLISQSGTYVAQTVSYLEKRGISFSKAFSVGNEADVNIIDALEYLGEDDQTTAISMYIEAIRDVRRFLDVARKITPVKPIVAQYIGGSEAGGRAGKSHTGAMAGKNHLYNGLFDQAGVMRVHSVEDLYLIGWALATQPRIKGNRIGIVTNSGGPGSAIADTLETNGCIVPPFSEALQAEIRPMLEIHAPCGNPVDLTFALDMPVMTEKIPDIIMKSGEVDGIVLHGAMSTGFMRAIYPSIRDLIHGMSIDEFLSRSEGDVSGAVSVPFKNNVPMTVSSFFDRSDHYTKSYEDNHVPVFDAPEKAARGMAALVKYHAIEGRSHAGECEIPDRRDKAGLIIRDARVQKKKVLDEYLSKQLLKAYGIPVPDEFLVSNETEASAAADALSFPVAVKVCDPDIMHKTDQGMVHLNISDRKGLSRAFSDIQEKAGRTVPVLVSEMIAGRRELLCGVAHEELFGSCVAFGAGGIFAEAMGDVVYRMGPICLVEADEMMDSLKAKSLLGKYRGMLPADRTEIARILSILSALPSIHEEIAEIDINPIIISKGRPVAADALIILK